jgi:hypothetical protein
MKTKETHTFYPGHGRDSAKMCELLAEILTTLYSRADGVKIEIERTTELPKLSPVSKKPIIQNIKITTWDIAA